LKLQEMKTIKLSRQDYHGKSCIFIDCDSDPIFNRMISSFPGRKWSREKSTWYIEDREEIYRELLNYFRDEFNIDARDLHRPAGVRKVDKGVTEDTQ